MNELQTVKQIFSYDTETKELKQRGKKIPFYIETLQYRHDGKKCAIGRARAVWILYHNKLPSKPISVVDKTLPNPYIHTNLVEGRVKKPVQLFVSHNDMTGYSCVRWLAGRQYKQKSFIDERELNTFISSFGSFCLIKYEKHRASKHLDI